jgi:hypothetical protein
VSHKYTGKSTLLYKLVVDNLAGNLAWIQGPYPASKYTNIKIINMVLRHFLKLGKRVKANKGYCGNTEKIKCPGNNTNSAEKRVMQGRVEACHKTLNRWLKKGFSPRSSATTSQYTAMCSFACMV